MGANNSENLIDFVTGLVGEKVLKIDEDLGLGFFRLHLSEAERRQALQDIKSVEDCLIELLRNSRDAGAKHIFVSTNRDQAGIRRLRVIDDGQGIPANMREMIFEPRVTSRLEKVVADSYGVHGRGMALFSIKSSLAKNNLVASAPGLGSVFSLDADTSDLSEKRDQSTFPRLRKEGDEFSFSGPHNIPRVMTEFAVNHQDIVLFLGAPAEIISTMIHEANKIPLLPPVALKELPFWRRPAAIENAAELSAIAETYFDIHISLRTAHRIINGEVALPPAVLDNLNQNKRKKSSPKSSDSTSMYSDNRNMTKNISPQDKAAFAQVIAESFRQLGEKYFIKIQDEPKIKYGKQKIDICFLIEDDQGSDI